MASAFKVEVGRSGILFSTEVAVETIAKILAMRDRYPEVGQYHDGLRARTTPIVVMPMDMQKSLQRQAMDMWFKENPNIKAELNRKCVNRTQHARTARMVYRRACFKMCGGIEWMNFLLAVGDINDLLISCAKQASTELVEARKRKLGDAYREPEVWQPAAFQRREDRAASASSAGLPKFKGVVHNVAKSKQLRTAGHRLDKQIAKQKAAWDAGESNMSWHAWRQLCTEADRVWADAHEASEALGVEYKACDGTIRFKRTQADTWVGRILTYYHRAICDDNKVAPLRG